MFYFGDRTLSGIGIVHKIVIDSRTQSLSLFRGTELVFEAPISTSRFGLGFENGSRKTPTGTFCIHQKIGDQMPVGTVFKGRKPVTTPDGRAVRIGNDASMLLDVRRIDLWDDQRNLQVHPEGGGIIDYHGSGGDGMVRVFPGGPGASAEQCDVDRPERIL